MSLMTDVDITKAIGRDIVIDPFCKESLTPIGYDFTIGDYVFSLENGLIEPDNGSYSIPPKSTVQILTKESLWVSGRIGGTFHSKVSLVSKGLSHISTTLDPGWYGPLLITMRNNMDNEITIKVNDSFVTLLFYRVDSPTSSKHFKPEFRRDILLSQLNHQTEAYIQKIGGLLNNHKALDVFQSRVEEANLPMRSKVIASARSKGARELARDTISLLIFILIVAIALLGFFWNWVKPVFQNVNYDTKIVAVQFSTIIALISVFLNIRKR